MALEEYRRKRDFRKTPEPAGRPHGRRAPASGGAFVVQKHAARRLHYDFRLELDGVMKSWAVPKGPSLDPRERRLAVHTEDHPMEYNSFEGVIPAGEYGGGTVLLWDRGTWRPQDQDPAKAYAKGNLKFTLDGGKLKGGWALVRMGGRSAREAKENWLLIKERDEVAIDGSGTALVDDNPLSIVTGRDLPAIAADRDRVWNSNRGEAGEEAPVPPAASADFTAPPKARKRKLPNEMDPQLATLVATAPAGSEWLHEIKFDGYRILAFIDGGKVRLQSRNGLDWTGRFPRLARRLSRLPVRTALLDGEVVALDEKGISSFGALQEALSAGRTDDLVYYVFDLLHRDGYDLTETPLEARKAVLRGVVGAGNDDIVRYSDHQEGEGAEFLRNACTFALEGIVSKRRDAPYRPGRSRAWIKAKCVNRDEFAIIGWTDPGGARTGFGSLVLGHYDKSGKLHYAGRVGTGFDERFLSEFHRALKKLPSTKSPFRKLPAAAARGVHWVEPHYVGEVQYTGWTRDGMLRHPAFVGLREDKTAKEAVLVDPVSASVDGESTSDDGQPSAPARKRSAKRGTGASIEVAGVRLSNPEKVLYPGAGITKLDLARYYESVAGEALRHLAHRPLTLVRCPEGEGGECFFQKHIGSGIPAAVRTVDIAEKEDGIGTYLVIEDLAGIVSLVQMGVLEMHPWGSTVDDIERPDQLIFDLDPDVGLGWDRIIEAALALRRLLGELGLESFAKTTGGKGLHVVVPVKPSLEWEPAKAFTKAVAEAFAAAEPARYTAVMAKKARKGRLFIDYLRNGRGNTAVGGFSTRARPGAPVSVPVTWDEVMEGIRSDAFDIFSLPKRLKRQKKDPWAGFERARQPLDIALRKLGIG